MSSATQIMQLSNEEIVVKVDFIQIKKSAAILRALNHKLRQQIIKMLDDSNQMTVTEMYIKLRIEQSVASQHLAILRRANIVVTKREGKFMFYALNYQRITEISNFIAELVK
jgi:DNA-binding transcriptional ArsR family regulator